MASLVILKNPLSPHEREIHPLPAGSSVIDWLQDNYPLGFGMPVEWYINHTKQNIDDLDYQPEEDDTIVITCMPGEPISITTALVYLAVAVAVGVATYAVTSLFSPDVNKAGGGAEEQSVFQVSSAQNAARVGQPVPVAYGNILITPDYASQPNSFYLTNMSIGNGDRELSLGIQYLDSLLCLGQGDVDVEEIFVGETNIKELPSGIVQYKVFKPTAHNNVMGSILPGFIGGDFHENVVTSTEASNQEFSQVGQSVGPFVASKRGITGSVIECDIVFPAGLYTAGSNVNGREVPFDITFEEIDNNDDVVPGSEFTVAYEVSNRRNATIGSRNGVELPQISVDYGSNDPQQNSSLRITLTEIMPKSSRWSVKITRQDDISNANNGASKFLWTSLRMLADYTSDPVYGDVTLLAVRIRASNAIGGDATVRISCQVQRRIPILGQGTVAVTNNPADAFMDIYRNNVYGAGRPLSEIDLVKLEQLRTLWAGYEFNYYFTNKITVWNALAASVQAMVAEPLPIGAFMSVAQDGVKPLRAMTFSDDNIVESTFSINYDFDLPDTEDGVEVEYRDPLRYKPAYARWPANSINPKRVVASGCTNEDHALEYAVVYWQRRQLQRKTIEFQTEMEGLILNLGDRIAVSHSVPMWGQGGIVVGQNGNQLLTDRHLDWTGAGPWSVILTDIDGTPTGNLTVTQGPSDHIIELATASPIPIQFDSKYENTRFLLFEQSETVQDFTVETTRPVDDVRVTVLAAVYNPAVFDNGMPFLGGVQNRIRNHIVPLDNVSVYRGMMKHTWSPGIIRGSTS